MYYIKLIDITIVLSSLKSKYSFVLMYVPTHERGSHSGFDGV